MHGFCIIIQFHLPILPSLLILLILPTRQQDVAATSKWRLSVCPSDVAVTSQMKHPTTSRWYVSATSYWNVVTTSQEDVTTTSHQCVSSTSQTSLKWNTQRRLSGTSPRRLSGTYPWRLISTSLRRLLLVPIETLNNVAVVVTLRCCDALLIGLYYAFKLLCHDLNLEGFHVSFMYQIKQ